MAASSSQIRDGWIACAGGVLQARGRSLWMVRSGDSQNPVTIESAAGCVALEPRPASHLVGLSRNAKIRIVNERVDVHEVCVPTLVKLIAFIDFSMHGCEPVPPSSIRRSVSTFCAAGFSEPAPVRIQREFIGRVIGDDPHDAPLFEFLRATEAYWVVSFLLQQFAENKRVSDLGAQYGLSNAHFRRLCKIALGGSLKAELKRWRAASAVLRIIESEQTLTDIALDAGFASSSHLSREIKGLLGVPPSQIWGFGVGKRWTRGSECAALRARGGICSPMTISPAVASHLYRGAAR